MLKNNPNFLQNFHENKLTQSVKLSEFRNANMQIKNQQYIRDSNAPLSQQQKLQENSQKSLKMVQVCSGQRSLMQNMKQIKTQYSQISGTQTGFKKLKGNQIQTLKELRNQYQVLKNLQAGDNKRKKPKKMIQNSSHSISQRDSASSVSQSRTSSFKQFPKDTNFKQQKLWNVERKQYQLIISNCQQKIQELLHAQMQYKKTIYELRNMPTLNYNTKNSVKSNQSSQQFKQLQRIERDSRQKSLYLQNQLQKARTYIKQINEKVIKLQDQLTIRDQDANRLQQQKKKLQDLIRLQKDKYMTNQIQKKKIQMEYEILQRDKVTQINRLLRQLQNKQALAQQDLKYSIKRLQQQIQVKDRRYYLLLQQLQNKKKQMQQKQILKQMQKQQAKIQQNVAMEAFGKLITQNRNNKNEQMMELMSNLLNTLQNKQKRQPPKPYNETKLFNQIKLLKAQIQYLRHSKNDTIDIQPIKRAYQNQISGLKQNIFLLQQKLRKAKKSNTQNSSPSIIKSPSQQLTNKSLQIMRLNKRIQQLQNILYQKQLNIKQQQQYIILQKNRQSNSQNQIRALKRRGDQYQFQLQKHKKQTQFNISMMRRQNQTNMKIKNGQLAKAQQGINYWKNEFEKVKRFYQQKIQQKNKIIQQTQTIQISSVRKQYDQRLQYAKKQYQQQIKHLAQKLSNQQKQFGNQENWKRKCLDLQNTLYDLRKYNQKSRQLNQGIDHLWTIKQTEYYNVNQILKSADYRF